MSAAATDAAEDAAAAAIEPTNSAGAATDGKRDNVVADAKLDAGDAGGKSVPAGNGDAAAVREGEPQDNNNINNSATKANTSKDESPSPKPTDSTTRASPPVTVAPAAEDAAAKVESPAKTQPTVEDTKKDDWPGKKSPKSEPDEFLDVMSSLEREIAEMHHVEPTPPALAKRVSHDDDIEPDYGSDEKVVLLEMKPPGSASRPSHSPAQSKDTPPGKGKGKADDIIASVEDTLEHDELIAVLKGIDQPTAAAADAAEGGVGVTIEGEGEFQIMEIIDDEAPEAVAESATVKELRASAELRVGSPPSASVKKVAPARKSHVLTQDEVRALAMEQMAGLQTRRRKQPAATSEGKEGGSTATPPPPAPSSPGARSTPSGDLVSSLGAEWSDDDEEGHSEGEAPKEASKPKGGSPSKGKPATKPDTWKIGNTTVRSPHQEIKKEPGTGPAEKAATKPTTDKKQETTIKVEKTETRNPAGGATGAPTPAGFTRTRIIKRKIIWDPDAPETATTYAKTVRVTKKATEPQGKQAASGAAASPKSRVQVVVATAGAKTAPATSSSPLLKRRSVTPVTNGSAAAAAGPKKKKITEIDRLMGDEGAVNMLNALQGKRSAGVEAESHRPLMRSRSSAANEAKATTPTPASSSSAATKSSATASVTAATPAAVVKKESPPTVAVEISPSPLNPAVVVQTASSTKGKRQGSKPKPSSTWDFVYQQQQLQQEDSMIIRRRSNSSYSSNASVRLSVDAPPEALLVASGAGDKPKGATPAQAKGGVPLRGHAAASGASKLGAKFEFAKPESKTSAAAAVGSSAMGMKIHYVSATGAAPAAKGRGRPVKGPNAPSGAVAGSSSPTPSSASSVGGGSGNKRVAPHAVVKRNGNVCHIVFTTTDAKISYTFTGALMNKLVALLNQLANDDQCNAVLMITHMPHFCQGIDVTPLTVGNLEKRKQAAMELASSVKNYLKTLATFPKPLLAGVNGNNIGLGVTQLALFDVVVGSEKSSYETPYAKIGQLPEGHCFWLNSPKLKGNFRTKLFWYCEKVQNTEPVLGGLLNKLTQPGKVIDEVLQIAQKLASYSPQAYRAMKATPIQWGMPFIVKAMDEEFDTIVEQWTSNECYHYFKSFVEEKARS